MITLLLAIGLSAFAAIVWAQMRHIGADESGLVVTTPEKQVRLITAGWHLGLWRWRYQVVKFPLVHS